MTMDPNAPDGQTPFRTELVVAGTGLSLAGLLWWAARDLPESPYEPLGPGGFPSALAVLLGGLSVLLLLRARLTEGSAERRASIPSGVERRRGRLAAIGTIALTVLYALALDRAWAPFLISTTAYLVLAGAMLVKPTLKSLALAVVVGTVAGLAIYVLFKVVFMIDLS